MPISLWAQVGGPMPRLPGQRTAIAHRISKPLLSRINPRLPPQVRDVSEREEPPVSFFIEQQLADGLVTCCGRVSVFGDDLYIAEVLFEL